MYIVTTVTVADNIHCSLCVGLTAWTNFDLGRQKEHLNVQPLAKYTQDNETMVCDSTGLPDPSACRCTLWQREVGKTVARQKVRSERQGAC